MKIQVYYILILMKFTLDMPHRHIDMLNIIHYSYSGYLNENK